VRHHSQATWGHQISAETARKHPGPHRCGAHREGITAGVWLMERGARVKVLQPSEIPNGRQKKRGDTPGTSH